MQDALRQANAMNGVRSVEQAQAAKYDANGQKTGQPQSYFSWWMAVDESEGMQNGMLMDYMSIADSARKDEKVRIIGESAGVGRIINDRLNATFKPNGTVWVTLEDETEVALYPNAQIKPNAGVIHNYWFTDTETGQDLTFEEVKSQIGNADFYTTETLLEIHGRLSDNREKNGIFATCIIDYAGKRDGSLLATGAGQRYILRQPTTESEIRAWRSNAANSQAAAVV